MKKILTIIDVYLTSIIPYMFIVTVALIGTKAFGYISYSWLVVFAPLVLTQFSIGIINFLVFVLDKLDKGDEDKL